MTLSTKSTHFGLTADGRQVTLYTLCLSGQIEVRIMDYGATLSHIIVPDRNGKMEDVVLGFDSFEGFLQKDYLDNYCYLGSTVGRMAGRITDNKLILEGQCYQLPPNRGDIHIHGGVEGWDRKLWSGVPVQRNDAIGVRFSYTCPDKESHYPGNLSMEVTYWLDHEGSLKIYYEGTTDRRTVLNPTNHSYFNLSGDFSTSIEDHILKINASSFLPLTPKSLPTGEILPVKGTPFDFGTAIAIKERINLPHPQLDLAGGIDHCFVIEEVDLVAAVLFHRGSGRMLTVKTSEPGLQVYTGNYLRGAFQGKQGTAYSKRAAICLETQHFADSTNHPEFPSVILEPGMVFQSTTTFKFSVS